MSAYGKLILDDEDEKNALKFIWFICKFLLTILVLGILWLIDSNSLYHVFYAIRDFLPVTLKETFGTCFINLFVISIMYGLTRIFVEFMISTLIWGLLLLLLLILFIVVIYAKITN